MNKTSRTLFALALTASTFATGCAVDSAACADDACDAAATESFAPKTDLTMREASPREAVLAAWTIRLADGDNDGCDDRVVRYFEEQATDLVLDGCERSFIPALGAADLTLGRVDTAMQRTTRAFGAGDYGIEDPNAVSVEAGVGDYDIEDLDAGRPVLVLVGDLTVAEREWVLLGLDLAKNEPLTARQDVLLGRADELVFHTNERDAGRSDDAPPRFSPEYL